MSDKFTRMSRSLPSLYKPEINTYIRGLLKSWGLSDDQITIDIQNAKEQLFVKTAVGRSLDRLGNNVGVNRAPELGIDDGDFQDLVPVLSFFPKQVRGTVISLLDVFWGPGFTRANISSGNPETYNFGPELGIAGTSTFRKGERIVRGVGTSYLSDIQPGDYIRPSSLDGTFYHKVSAVLDNTTLELSLVWTHSTTVGTAVTKGTVQTLQYITDGKEERTLRFIPDAFEDLTAVTIDELVNFINNNVEHNQYIAASKFLDPVLGSRLNIRTNTPGLLGSIQITGGTANAPTILNFSTAVQTDTRCKVLEINPNEIVVQIPSSVPVLRRSLRGSAHPKETKAKIYSDEEVFDFSSFVADPVLNVTIDGTPNVVTFDIGTLVKYSQTSVQFNDISESLSVNNNASLNMTNALTISGWVRHTGGGLNIFRNFTFGDFSYVSLLTAGGLPLFAASTDGGTYTSWQTLIPYATDGNWHHIVWTWQVNQEARCWVDGTEVTVARTGSLVTTSLYQSPVNYSMGAALNVSGLDEVAIFDAVVPDLDITGVLYNSGSPQDITSLANLQAFYRMGDGDSSPTILDNSVNSNNASMINMDNTNFVANTPGVPNVFMNGDFIDNSKVTSEEIARVINAQLMFLQARTSCTDSDQSKVELSTTEGSSEYQVTGGDANTVLNFPTTLQQDPDLILSNYPSSYVFDPTGQQFTVLSVNSDLSVPVVAGTVSSTINLTDASDFPNIPGKFVLDFGRKDQEGPIAYTSRPNNSTLLIDASYIFQKDHAAGRKVNLILDSPTLPRLTGDDYPFFVTGTEEARVAAQDLIKRLLAAGVVIRFIIDFPEFLFVCTCRDCGPSDSPDQRGSRTDDPALQF